MSARESVMQNLVSIGRFSELSGLTVKALRLYDKLGLLRPALVDFATGYRYYSPDQVPVARRIRLLRKADMPLEDIRTLLTADDVDEVQQHLARHRALIGKRIADYQRALRRLPTAEQWYESTGKGRTMKDQNKTYTCSFCGKQSAEVRRMIAGPKGVFICNECVALCNELIAKEEAEEVRA